MKTLSNILDRTPVDNKLLTSLLALILTRAVVDVLRDDNKEDAVSLGVPFVVGGLVGYQTPNDGSILRRADQEDGNPLLPDDEAVPAENLT